MKLILSFIYVISVILVILIFLAIASYKVGGIIAIVVAYGLLTGFVLFILSLYYIANYIIFDEL